MILWQGHCPQKLLPFARIAAVLVLELANKIFAKTRVGYGF